MKFTKPHFVYDEKKELCAAFARVLMPAFGQADLRESRELVSIGGDGNAIETLRMSEGRPVCALTPPGSNSNGFWTIHGIDSAEKLARTLEHAEEIPLVPLKAQIRYTNGNAVTLKAFCDFAVASVSGQAAIINLTAKFNGLAMPPQRIMGDGLIFSTAFGSTGTSKSYGGPIVDLHNNVIILTGKGVYSPQGGITPLVNKAEGVIFDMTFGSAETKRPVRIDYDGYSAEKDKDGSPIESMTISIAPAREAAKLVVSENPAIRAYKAMYPRT